MVHLPRLAFAILFINFVLALAAPADPPGTTITDAEPVGTPSVVVPVSEPITTATEVVPVVVPIPPGVSQIARFENDGGIPRSGGKPINTYRDILWKGMSLAETKASLAKEAPGLVPNSPPNYASFSLTDKVTIKQGTSQMTTVYPDTNVAFFNLYSFYYGCASKSEDSEDSEDPEDPPAESADPLPASCKITITGFNSTGEQVSEQSFAFEADGQQQQMPKAVAEGFSGVSFVRFDIEPEDEEGAAAYIDSVDYEVFGS